jgi:Recombinase
LVFTKFAELQSARQVHIWLREESIELPVKSRHGESHGVVCRLPAYNIVHNILTNPIYAGAYAFGRTKSRVSVEGGRKRIRRGVQKPMAKWDVLIKDHHAAYITWEEARAAATAAAGAMPLDYTLAVMRDMTPLQSPTVVRWRWQPPPPCIQNY